jgi:Ca2+-binding EF-hand superfamily protein
MFVAFDKEETGRVNASEFRRVLDNFCFKMTDEQFKGLMNKIKVEGDNMVDYEAFLSTFTLGETKRIQAVSFFDF